MNLAPNSVTANLKPSNRMGRPKGASNIVQRLARENLGELFDMLGGVQGMYEWAQQDARNLYAFYVYIYPKILGVQQAQRGETGPVVTRITNVVVDPVNGREETIRSVEILPPQRDIQNIEYEQTEDIQDGMMPI